VQPHEEVREEEAVDREELREIRDELREIRAALERIERLEGLRAHWQEHTIGRLVRAEQRLRWWASPKLGRLDHHRPEPLEVPRRYLTARPPSPPPKITLVTPSYGQATFLGRAIRSVLDQGYPALEYVVQDGGSTDGSVDVLRAHEGSLARWESAPDAGQANAINLGFADTGGEIMGWLNSDDVLLPGALAYVARHLAEHPGVDVVYGQRLLIDEHGRKVGAWVTPPHDGAAMRLIDFVPQETLFWRRGIWERSGAHVDERLRYAIDWDLLLRFADAGARIVRLPRFLGAFRVHGEQKTTSEARVGIEEGDRLRERVHGRRIEHEEAVRMVAQYLRRHVPLHLAHRLSVRLPLPRVPVDASPIPPPARP
jgi:glycosyltransferase involved in cell wall biosynthesis